MISNCGLEGKSLWREFSGQGMNGLDCVKGKDLFACQERSPGLVVKSHTHTSLTALFNGAFVPKLVFRAISQAQFKTRL